ncbi:hypothetical protein HRG_012676 [Hirsutella rhossiliensis]
MPREHPATVAPEEVHRTLRILNRRRPIGAGPYNALHRLPESPTMRSSVSCEIWTASAPKTEPAAVKLNPDLLHRRRRPPLHHRNDLDKSKRLTPPPTQPRRSPKDPGRCEKPFNFNETLSNPYCITTTPLSASRSRHHRQDPGATKFRLPSR